MIPTKYPERKLQNSKADFVGKMQNYGLIVKSNLKTIQAICYLTLEFYQ